MSAARDAAPPLFVAQAPDTNRVYMSKVLIVDDNRGLADDLAEILQTEGHQTDVAYGGHAALERAAVFDFDAALVDIRMPDMDGVALVHRLMCARPRSSYWFMTGDSSERSLSEAAAISQQAVLFKPLDISRVLRLVAASGLG
jgi:DNA-binding NtrC family response regulator